MNWQPILPPDLATLAKAGVTLLNLEAIGFSADSSTLLVRSQYFVDGDASGSHYAVWVYDVANSRYTACLNTLMAPGAGLVDVDIRLAAIAGRSDNIQIVAQVEGGDGSVRLVRAVNGVVVTDDLAGDLLGSGAEVVFERVSLDSSGRWLALQTSSALFDPSGPDVDDTSDVFLLDTTSEAMTVISVLPDGTQLDNPVYLGNVHTDGTAVRVAFATQDAFVTADKNAASGGVAATDAYLWSSGFNSNGLTGAATLKLISMNAAGAAVGGVDHADTLQATAVGVFFTSDAADLANNDANNAGDPFWGGGVAYALPLQFDSSTLFSGGATFLSADSQGNSALLLTTSVEAVTTPGATQVLSINPSMGTWQNVSGTETIVTDAVVSPDGARLAYSTWPADGSSEPALYLVTLDEPAQTTFDVTIQTRHWKSTPVKPAPISGVEILADRSTDAAGTVILADQPQGALTLTPSRTAIDKDKDQVGLLDAIAILKSIVGLTTLDAHQTIAADFDKQNGVGLLDAIGILKHVVGLPSAPPEWVFVDAAKASPNPVDPITVNVTADTTVQLIGILRGDVDGSWAG